MNKRQFLQRTFAGISALALAGCDRLNASPWFSKVLSAGESLNKGVHQFIGGRASMAQEFAETDISPVFRANGSVNPDAPAYRAMAAENFANWALKVDGLVEQPTTLTLAQLRAMPSRTQITRHDCVEGWSVIGKWTGVPLAQILAIAKPQAQARYVVFHCADTYGKSATKTPTTKASTCWMPITRKPYWLMTSTASRCRWPTARRYGCAWSGNSATSTPSSSRGWSSWKVSRTSAAARAATGRIVVTPGTREFKLACAAFVTNCFY